MQPRRAPMRRGRPRKTRRASMRRGPTTYLLSLYGETRSGAGRRPCFVLLQISPFVGRHRLPTRHTMGQRNRTPWPQRRTEAHLRGGRRVALSFPQALGRERVCASTWMRCAGGRPARGGAAGSPSQARAQHLRRCCLLRAVGVMLGTSLRESNKDLYKRIDTPLPKA
jgi:hypothetical protein